MHSGQLYSAKRIVSNTMHWRESSDRSNVVFFFFFNALTNYKTYILLCKNVFKRHSLLTNLTIIQDLLHSPDLKTKEQFVLLLLIISTYLMSGSHNMWGFGGFSSALEKIHRALHAKILQSVTMRKILQIKFDFKNIKRKNSNKILFVFTLNVSSAFSKRSCFV